MTRSSLWQAGRIAMLAVVGNLVTLAGVRFPGNLSSDVAFADMPAGETRHLYCNRAVPEAWLARFDQALAAQPR